MPKLSRMLGPTATISIPVPDDEPLIVEYRRQAATPRLLGRLADYQRSAADDTVLSGSEAIETICELYASVIVSWNLTDDDGNVIPTDAESLADVAQSTLELIMEAIRSAVSVDPTSSAVSSNGSLAAGESASLQTITA